MAGTDNDALAKAVLAAITVPGSVIKRDGCCSGCGETHGEWQARAVLEAIRPYLAKPAELDESGRFQVEEARQMLARWWADRGGEDIYGTERTLHDHARNLLALVDKIAPKENDDA